MKSTRAALRCVIDLALRLQNHVAFVAAHAATLRYGAAGQFDANSVATTPDAGNSTYASDVPSDGDRSTQERHDSTESRRTPPVTGMRLPDGGSR